MRMSMKQHVIGRDMIGLSICTVSLETVNLAGHGFLLFASFCVLAWALILSGHYKNSLLLDDIHLFAATLISFGSITVRHFINELKHLFLDFPR